MMCTPFPTPYPVANQILAHLHSRVQGILGDAFTGMYIHGSLANGGFDEHSDIDIVIVTEDDLTDERFSALHKMHTEIAELDSPWAVQLEVSYIPQNALRRFDRSNIVHAHLDRGSGEVLHKMAHESDWIIQRYILRERGIVVAGPDPKALIDAVSPDDLRNATMHVLPLWLEPILADPKQINKRGYQSFFVLSLCRILYTLEHGEIIPKPSAARWALDNLDERWRPLIERALIGRQNPNLDAVPEDIHGTLDMMRYTLQQINPTPYADVNEVLNLLLCNVKEILGEQFVGMYLYGSLSSGDFNPETSDIDFLVVTTTALTQAEIARLDAMHQETWAMTVKRAGKLEGAYVPRELIRRHDPGGADCPTVNEGRFYVAGLGSDWIIQRHVVREYGVVVEGPDPKTLIDFVGPDDIRDAVRGVLEEWWFPMLADPSWLREHGGAYHSFAILTMCRALHALEHGTVVSKPAAARWAQDTLGGKWRQIIAQSLRAQKPAYARIDLLEEALELIGYTQETLKV